MRRISLLLTFALAAALVVIPAGVAEAACGPAGGGSIPQSTWRSNNEFVFFGKGWGHGVGMSQYGAQGAAQLGCTPGEILRHYYQGTTTGQVDTTKGVRIGLIPNTPSASKAAEVNLENQGTQAIKWVLEDSEVARQQPGSTWSVNVFSNGRYQLIDESANPRTEVWQGGDPSQSLKVHLDDQLVRVIEKGRRYRYGTIEFRSEVEGTTAGMYVTIDVPSIELYLRGLAEMPSSFPDAALQAQAIVGRSYAYVNLSGWKANCRCHMYDSVYSQAYSGWDKESEGANAQWGRRWVSAVQSTAGTVMLYNGSVATGNYASSHGGHSDSAAFVWGGGKPYLTAVDDSRWDLASSNPYRTWTTALGRAEIGRAFGVGLALEIRTPDPKGAGGRVGSPSRGAGGMVVVGTQGRRTVSGDEARSKLGLRSTKFVVTSPPSPLFTGTPLSGDWDGDGDEEPGWFNDGEFFLRQGQNDLIYFKLGVATDEPVVGDWDGDGVDSVGVVRGNRWYLTNRHEGGHAQIAFAYGSASDRAIVGDWDGDGTDTAGVVRGNRFYLRNGFAGGNADAAYAFGRPSDRVVVGDWDGDGQTTVGVVRGNRWYLSNRHVAPRADISFVYGRSSDQVITGDWDANRSVTAGIVRGSTWYLDNRHDGGNADQVLDLSLG